MMFLRTALIFLVMVGLGAMPAASWAKDKDKPPKVSELLKDANDYMSQAQAAYIDGKAKEAIELYRKALAEIVRVEQENEGRIASAELAPVRFRKALCETEIDRIMLEEVNATARTMAVTDTSALEAKRAERKKAAATNNVPDEAVSLAAKQGGKKGADGSVADPAPKNDKQAEEPPAEPDKPVNVGEEIEWAKDMISMDRFDDAEKALVAVLKAEPENRDARFLMAMSRVQQGRPADAVVVVDDLLSDNPNDEAVLLLAAGAHMANGQYAKAMDSLDKAMKVDPKRPDGYLNMAWLLLEMNPKESSEAEMYYRQAVKLGAAHDRDMERRLGIKPQ